MLPALARYDAAYSGLPNTIARGDSGMRFVRIAVSRICRHL